MTSGAEIGTLSAVRVVGPGAEHLADDEPVDVFLSEGTIVDIAPHGVLRPRGEVLDAQGHWAVPGLWDNHVHTVQWALSSERASVSGADSAAGAARLIAGAVPRADGRLIGIGYRDALWPDAPSLDALDAATGQTATYLIKADVHSVWLNSAALRREGVSSADGVLREQDAFEISKRLDAVDEQHADAAVRRAGEAAAARGVTGIVDFDMAWNLGAWERRVRSGAPAQRVEFAVYPEDLDRAIGAGLRTGDALPGSAGLVRVGSLKVITDGSLGTRTAACSHPYPAGDDRGVLTVAPDELIALVVRATGAGLAVALHAIGDRAASSALDAVAIAGATGSIEHAQLVRHADLARIARLGLTASIQPQHALDDRDLAEAYWAEQTAIAYPMASLLRAGARVRLGSDAPVAPLDPWQAIAAAVERTDDDRAPWHPEERLSTAEAIAASTRSALCPGDAADIAVCALDPRTASGSRLRQMPVIATLCAARVTHGG